MIRYSKKASCFSAAVALCSGACFGPGGVLGNDQGEEDQLFLGSISVTTTTTGGAPDPNGYIVSLDEARTEPIGTNGAVTFSPIPAGTYGVLLFGMDGSCSVATPNPTFVTLLPDSSITTNFDVDCP